MRRGEAARAERLFEIDPETLVLAATADVPLLVAHGTPAAAVERHRETYLLGLLGASLAIVGAMLFAIMLVEDSDVTLPGIVAIGSVVLVIGLAAFVGLSNYNAVIALQQRADKAWSNIDVALKQRHDMLPNLVDAVRGLMAFEQQVLTEVTLARAAYSPTDPIPTQAATSALTTAAVRSACSRSSSGTRRSSRGRT